MPLFLVLPIIGKVAVSVGAVLWGGAAAAGGTAAVVGHKNSKARSKAREANRITDEANAEMDSLLESLNRQYRKFFDQGITQYKAAYEALRAKMAAASETVSPSVKRPSSFVFRDRLSRTDLSGASLNDVDWGKVKRVSAETMRASHISSRLASPTTPMTPGAAGNTAAMGGIAAAFSIMGGFIEASERRVTQAAKSLATAETYAAGIKAMKSAHRKSVREDIAARREALASLFAILDEELAKQTPFAEAEKILIAAGNIISQRCFPRAAKR